MGLIAARRTEQSELPVFPYAFIVLTDAIRIIPSAAARHATCC
ncbi:hypothetical protein Hsw_2992 [Hymenobacter swuensis DY53]|uniref:Uncharacterized protein n=1 Tax=Hymenobacter swuensis DY53 TaxID=1227739 RepID=W8F3J0_9BACT|nr:hypothetical protein Hsw_2992 [Hymenobacter swuensis DY53]